MYTVIFSFGLLIFRKESAEEDGNDLLSGLINVFSDDNQNTCDSKNVESGTVVPTTVEPVDLNYQWLM